MLTRNVSGTTIRAPRVVALQPAATFSLGRAVAQHDGPVESRLAAIGSQPADAGPAPAFRGPGGGALSGHDVPGEPSGRKERGGYVVRR